jgi:phosphotransacetylase
MKLCVDVVWVLELAMREVRRRSTLIGALLVHFGEADGMICGTFGHYHLHLDYVEQIIGLNKNAQNFYAMNVLMMKTAICLLPTLTLTQSQQRHKLPK